MEVDMSLSIGDYTSQLGFNVNPLLNGFGTIAGLPTADIGSLVGTAAIGNPQFGNPQLGNPWAQSASVQVPQQTTAGMGVQNPEQQQLAQALLAQQLAQQVIQQALQQAAARQSFGQQSLQNPYANVPGTPWQYGQYGFGQGQPASLVPQHPQLHAQQYLQQLQQQQALQQLVQHLLAQQQAQQIAQRLSGQMAAQGPYGAGIGTLFGSGQQYGFGPQQYQQQLQNQQQQQALQQLVHHLAAQQLAQHQAGQQGLLGAYIQPGFVQPGFAGPFAQGAWTQANLQAANDLLWRSQALAGQGPFGGLRYAQAA
jgi:hypothetical protein